MKDIEVQDETVPVGDEVETVTNHDLLVQIADEIDRDPEQILYRGENESDYGGLSKKGAEHLLLHLSHYSQLNEEQEQHIKNLELQVGTPYIIDSLPDYTRTKIIGIVGEICEAETNHDSTGFSKKGKKQVIETLQTGDFSDE